MNNGGTPVIDYTLSYGVESGSFNNAIGGIVEATFTVTGMTAGVTYKFKV
jgi:hypothetical protein